MTDRWAVLEDTRCFDGHHYAMGPMTEWTASQCEECRNTVVFHDAAWHALVEFWVIEEDTW